MTPSRWRTALRLPRLAIGAPVVVGSMLVCAGLPLVARYPALGRLVGTIRTSPWRAPPGG